MFKDEEASWPVTNEEPLDLVTEPGLTPGPALLSCSGSDIHLSKGASTRPNPEKQKGRYVMMFPGMLSFRRQSQQNDKENNNKQEGKTESESQNEDGDTQNSSENKGNKESNNPPSVKQANATTVLGRIKGLKSGRPTITIPYPNGGILTLKGQQIESSSRFMMLNFKRGKVTCKDAVSSVLVFGEPTWSGDEPIPYRNDSNEASLEHYGGSERTIDGGRTVKFRKSRNAPIFVKQQSNKTTGKTPVSGPESSDPKGEDSEEEDSDAYVEEGVGDCLSRGASKTLSRRSRSCTSKEISYGDKSSEEEDSSAENTSEEEKEEEPKEKLTGRRKRNSQQNKKHPSQRTSSSKKTATKVINLSDDEDDSCSYLDSDRKLPSSSQISDSSGRRSSRVRKRISYGEKGSDEESSEEESSDDKEVDAQKGDGAKRGKSRETKNKSLGKNTISLKEENAVPKEKITRQRKPNSKQKLSQSTKLSSKQKKSNNDTKELSEDDSDESSLKGDGIVQDKVSTLSSSSSKRSSRVRKRISYGDKGSEEEDETSNEEQSSDEEEDAQKENVKTVDLKKRGRRNVNNNKKTSAKSKAKERTVIKIDDSPPEKKKSTSKKGKTSSDPINIDDDNAKERDDANVKSPAKVIKHPVTAVKSPGRRRRRRSATTATTPPLSCSNRAKSKKKRNADDFNFDFTEEDEAIMTTPERKRMKRM